VIYLVALASIFVVLFGIRGTASILNPILLAVVITITGAAHPRPSEQARAAGLAGAPVDHPGVVLLLGLVIVTVFFSITKLSTQLPLYMAEAAASATEELPPEVTGTEVPVSTTELTIQLGPVAEGVVMAVLDLLVQFGMALFIFFS